MDETLLLRINSLISSSMSTTDSRGGTASEEVVEVDEPVGVLARADEVFLASTTRDVQAVSWLDGRELEAPGPVTAAAAATWSEREAADLDP